MVEIPASVRAQMIAHAFAGLPDEACGLFSGPFGGERITSFHPMTNTAASSQIYELDGQEFLDTERAVDEAGLVVLGVMHSHTHTTNYPSPTDIDDAARFDPFGAWLFLIVSLKHAEPTLRAYRILDGNVTEVPLVVTKD